MQADITHSRDVVKKTNWYFGVSFYSKAYKYIARTYIISSSLHL